MSTQHTNIQVEGFDFARILQVTIHHEPNEHGTARVVGEVPAELGQRYITRAEDGRELKIVSGNAEKVTFFDGIVTSLQVKQQAEYSQLVVEAMDKSYQLDIRKCSCSYQNTGKGYGDILQQAYGETGTLQVTGSDQAIGGLILQMDETNWAFTKRMASRFNVPVVADITAARPLVYFGLPAPRRTLSIDTASCSYGRSEKNFQRVSQNYLADGNEVMRQDFAALTVHSYDYGQIGDKVKLGGKEYRIRTVDAELSDGLMQMTYSLTGETGFVAPVQKNTNCAGRVLKAQVKAVKRDQIQAHLFEIDPEYDSGGDWWFPYSTAYSSSDGSGWYVMPEKDDYVRIMFPSKNETDAFAASSINASPPANTRNKSFKAPGGKEILLTDDGIYIMCQHQSIFIDLTQGDGIKIVSSQDIHVSSDANVTLNAEKKLTLLAKEGITLQAGDSKLAMKKDQVVLGAKNVIIT